MGGKIYVLLASIFVFAGWNADMEGYSYIPDWMPMCDVLLIIAHNSPQSKAYGWRYYQQLGTLTDQWNAGMRGAKINLHWYKPIKKVTQLVLERNEPRTCKLCKKRKKWCSKKTPYIALGHEPDGTTNCYLSVLQKSGPPMSALRYLSEFAQLLTDNPQEVAVLILEDYLGCKSVRNGTHNYTPEDTAHALHELLEMSGLAKYALKLDPEHYPNPDRAASVWPTVGYMRQTGKRLIIFTTDPAHALHSPVLNPCVGSPFNTTAWVFNWQMDWQARTCRMNICSPLHRGLLVHSTPPTSIPHNSLFGKLVNWYKRRGARPAILGVPLEVTDYAQANSFEHIMDRIAAAEKSANTCATLLSIDFVEIGQSARAVHEINKARIAQRSEHILNSFNPAVSRPAITAMNPK